MNIAFFDFDGTVTTEDTLFGFIRFAKGNAKFILGLFALIPVLIAYKLKFIPNYKAKQKMLSWFFKGCSEDKFKKIAYDYSMNCIDNIIRPRAIKKLNWHKSQNHKVVIVSASIDCWIRPWCYKNDFELIATKLEIKDSTITGNLITKNCHGKEKANRIKEIFDLSSFETIYAYGDSVGDKDMLALASKSFYKSFD